MQGALLVATGMLTAIVGSGLGRDAGFAELGFILFAAGFFLVVRDQS